MNAEQMKAIYQMAKSIYNKQEQLTSGKAKLYQKYGINQNSFADYYRAFQKMLDGELHSRSISSDLREFYLFHILEDYGSEKLSIALNAYKQSIIYYETTHNTHRKIEWELHDKYEKLLSSNSSEEQSML